jgi:hypothetical protein
VLLDGSKDYLDFGFSTALRLAGGITITAWVKSTSHPKDDAAMVSSALSLEAVWHRRPAGIGARN